jgi:pimeloyl-[acyl-carrier protein] methyl ester esterase
MMAVPPIMLHAETIGTGPDLVMLHGWSMHGGVLRDFAERLSTDFQVTLLDLPGHGLSPPLTDYSLERVTAALLAAAPANAHWLGWSLGALLALAVAERQPGRVRSLTLLAGTPRFTAHDGWPGVDPELLDQMAIDLERDYEGTVRRFIGMQTFGQDNARGLAKALQTRLAERPPAVGSALHGGLELLRDVDLRESLARFPGPVQALLGGRDRLVPRELGVQLNLLRPDLVLHELPRAAHLPFLTHAEETVARISAFLQVQDHAGRG